MSIYRHQPEAPTALRRLAPGGAIDTHWHDEHQIVYAATGVLSVTTGEGRWTIPPSLAIWVPARTTHGHRAYGTTDVHLVGFAPGENPLELTAPTALAVTPLLRELLIAATQDPGGDAGERARLRAVLLDRLRPASARPVHLPAPRDPRLVAVCAALHADPADGRSLAAFGAVAGAGERTLSRLFRAELGMTFPQWRTQSRLHHALVLLARDVPVTVVAHRCGWSTPSAFIDVYRRAFGHTPGRYAR
ncbi:AraC family transcriptional regulator [Amycolatopsis samaneae]|uniref:AraC family transcriptional regulator n=1 Tax=Amycolatopsis samaneae TaxID=664691 RepID=A0ABW5GBG2_9PSEU